MWLRGGVVLLKLVNRGVSVALALAVSYPARADQVAAPAPQPSSGTSQSAATPETPPEGEAVSVDLLTSIPDPSSVTMPALAFTATPEIEATYEKYYYFHRVDTSFTTALADLRECDAFARGLNINMGYTQAPYPYAGTMAGALGSAIGNAIAYAIFGSAQKRKLRRTNMRRCMHYKGYDRYGLKRDLWETFNFEEGLSSVKEVDRQRYLAQQAKVASDAAVTGRNLGL